MQSDAVILDLQCAKKNNRKCSQLGTGISQDEPYVYMLRVTFTSSYETETDVADAHNQSESSSNIVNFCKK